MAKPPASATDARSNDLPHAPQGSADASAEVERAGELTTVRLRGRLDGAGVSKVWRPLFGQLGQAGRRHARPSGPPPRRLRVDASGIAYCDGAGLGLLVELDRVARSAGAPAEFVGLNDDLRQLVDQATIKAPPPAPTPALSAVEQIGAATAALGTAMVDIVAFVGQLVAALAWAAARPMRIRWPDALLVAEKAGVNATPVVCLLGWLMGLIISFQAASPLERLGVENLIPTILAVAMVRELGPLVTAIVLAGRSGSAFAAEIGTMKVTEEINALTTFGLEPVRFLAIPRLLATMFMTPLLSLFATLFGLVGGFVIMAVLGQSLEQYINQILDAVDWVDLLGGLFKCIVFAFLVSAVGCMKGLQTRSGPGAVGDSTTQAVVAGIVLIVAADGVLGVVYYAIGI